MTDARPRLVLFDIDGTLLNCGRQVGALFLGVLAEVFGTSGDYRRHSFAGKTDPQIVFELMLDAGFDQAEIEARIPEVRSRYLPRLDAELDARRMRLMTGVSDLLAELHCEPKIAVGLLTGNWEGGARTKLARFGLNGYFAFGAFGDDAADRNRLPPVALDRARDWSGRGLSADQALIVGDTPSDVECAHRCGLRALAVATGHYGMDELAATGAEWVVTSLDCEEVRELLFD